MIEPNDCEEELVVLPDEPYRGIKPFRYTDRFIFSARNWEKDQLLNIILLYRGSLLYGQSGIGKSSLVNAGLVPLLLQNNLQAEIIRVYPNREETFRISRIENTDSTYFPSIFEGTLGACPDLDRTVISLEDFKRQLFAESARFDQDNNRPIPVLIFDQFEELITLFEETGKTAVAQNDLPVGERRDFQAELIALFRECYYNPDLKIKILFSFREDYLAKFSQLFRAIPDLRDHSLRIKAIDKEDIYGIIACPFSRNELSVEKYPALFSERFMRHLTEELNTYFGEGDAVLTDVQIVCQYVYETPAEKRELLFGLNGIVVKNSINNIIQLFYARLLEKLPAEDKPLAIAILSLLVLNEKTRNIFHTDAIVDELLDHYPADSINKVLLKLDNDTRLIKSELRMGSAKAYYEINSESLIPYINTLKVRKEGEEWARKRRKKFLYILAPSLVVIFALLFAFGQKMNNKQSEYLFAAAATRYSNPALSYIIVKEGHSLLFRNSRINSFLDSLDKQRKWFLAGRIFYPDQIYAAFLQKNGEVGVVGATAVDYFNNDGLMVRQQLYNKIIYADAKQGYLLNIPKSELFIGPGKAQKVNLYRFDGHLISSFHTQTDKGLIAVAPDGNFLIVDSVLYQKDSPDSKAITIFNNRHQLTAVTFSDDSKYIIAGFSNGTVIVYNLRAEKIRDFFAGYYGAAVTCLGISNDSKYLIAGGANNNLRLFELGNLNKYDDIKAASLELPGGGKDIYLEGEGIPGKINKIIMLPDNKTFLTLGEDKRGILWDFKGTKIDELIGHKEGITSAFISSSGNSILSCSAAGKIYTWNKGSISDAYNKGKLARFTPFEFRNVGLSPADFDQEYNTFNQTKLLTIILNYSASLPQYNYHVEDGGYRNILKTSLLELSNMYKKAVDTGYLKKLSVLNRKLLYNSYDKFEEDSLNLTIGRPNSKIDNFSRNLNKMTWQTRTLLVDTVNIEHATLLVSKFLDLAQDAKDTADLKSFQLAVRSLNTGIALGNAFKQKYLANASLDDILASSYGSLSYYLLFLREYKLAIKTAEKGILFGLKYNWIITNQALGHLLNGDYIQAERLYTLNKNRGIGGGFRTFKGAFLADFDMLEKVGIIDRKNKVEYQKVESIKKMLQSD